MATDAEDVRDVLKARLRVTTQSISDANSYLVQNYIQKTLNYALERYVATGTLTETTGTGLYYTSTSVASTCLKVISMHEAGASRSVMRVDWTDFWHFDRNWFYSTAGAEVGLTSGRVEAWAHVGHNMVAIYPASSGAVSCVYLKNTDVLDSCADAYYLDDKDMDLVYDLNEIVWHLNLRNYLELKNKIEMFSKTIAPYVGGE